MTENDLLKLEDRDLIDPPDRVELMNLRKDAAEEIRRLRTELAKAQDISDRWRDASDKEAEEITALQGELAEAKAALRAVLADIGEDSYGPVTQETVILVKQALTGGKDNDEYIR